MRQRSISSTYIYLFINQKKTKDNMDNTLYIICGHMAYPINPIGLIHVVLNYEPWDNFFRNALRLKWSG